MEVYDTGGDSDVYLRVYQRRAGCEKGGHAGGTPGGGVEIAVFERALTTRSVGDGISNAELGNESDVVKKMERLAFYDVSWQ